MISHKFVVQVLGDDHELLAWAEVYPSLKPNIGRASCGFVVKEPTAFLIEQDGLATFIAVHWCDLDVARINQVLEPTPVKAGQVVNYNWIEPVWLVSGMRDVPLKPVTVRESMVIGVPTGGLGMRV